MTTFTDPAETVYGYDGMGRPDTLGAGTASLVYGASYEPAGELTALMWEPTSLVITTLGHHYKEVTGFGGSAIRTDAGSASLSHANS